MGNLTHLFVRYLPASNISTHHIDSTQCLACKLGTYNAVLGASECRKCNTGKHFSATTTCQKKEADACSNCPPGKYGTRAGGLNITDGCSACDPGQYSTGTGTLSCTRCPKGTFSSIYGGNSSIVCKVCGSGKFAPFTGSSSCERCIEGRYLLDNGT